MDDHHVVVDISDGSSVSDGSYKSLETSIIKARPYSSTCCIYRVPPRLRSVNKPAYTPKLVSIGPLHHSMDKRFQMMEETKIRFLKNFIRQRRVSLGECSRIVKDKEEELRGFYQESFGSKVDFVKIILIDTIFIVELFLTNYSKYLGLPVEHDQMRDATWVLDEVKQDLLLLENQLPFFIIEDVWKCATGEWINKIFYDYFNIDMGLNLKAEDGLETIMRCTPMHFVDLVRRLYIPLKPRQPTGKAKKSRVPSATELHRAGVKFNMIKSKSLFDVSFSKSILKIPKWIIDDHTEVKFRNIIAFEQCHYGADKAYISHYSSLMDYLVDTSGDVGLLIEKEIIDNWLGDSNDVSRMINKLGSGVNISESDFYFADIFDDLNRYCETPRNKWMAILKQNYFNTPWAIISFCAALLLLLLTITQTVCSIISLKN